MTHLEYLNLNSKDRYFIMRRDAVQVAERVRGTSRYFLYQLGSFYIERKVEIAQNKESKKVRSFSSTSPLIPYIKHVDIASLFHNGGRD